MKCVHLLEAGVKMQTLGICMLLRTVLEMLFWFFSFLFFYLTIQFFFLPSSLIIYIQLE